MTTNEKIEPNETYRFHYTEAEMDEFYRLQTKSVYMTPILFALYFVLLLIFLIGYTSSHLLIGLVIGMLALNSSFHVKEICAYGKTWKKTVVRVCASTYEYTFFEDRISVTIYRENQKVREAVCYHTDIEQIQHWGKWLTFQSGGQLFIIRKGDLKENSAFFSYMEQNPSKVTKNDTSDKMYRISDILYVASMLTTYGALALRGAVPSVTHLFAQNMWLFFLLTPLPIASVVWSLVLKSKGYRYRTRLVLGILLTCLLCMYGSFAFAF